MLTINAIVDLCLVALVVVLLFKNIVKSRKIRLLQQTLDGEVNQIKETMEKEVERINAAMLEEVKRVHEGVEKAKKESENLMSGIKDETKKALSEATLDYIIRRTANGEGGLNKGKDDLPQN